MGIFGIRADNNEVEGFTADSTYEETYALVSIDVKGERQKKRFLRCQIEPGSNNLKAMLKMEQLHLIEGQEWEANCYPPMNFKGDTDYGDPVTQT